MNIKIAPNLATLENIYPAAFKVCGTVQKIQPVIVNVKFINENGIEYKSTTDENGNYCLFLIPGNYTANVILKESQSEKILW